MAKDEVLEVVQTHPAMRTKRLCACGCGQPKPPTAKFRPGHRSRISACRTRFRRLRQYASQRGIPFSIGPQDVQDLLLPLPDCGAAVQIERTDMAKGFEPGNLSLRPKKAPEQSPESHVSKPAVDVVGLRDLLIRRATRQIRLCFGETKAEPPVSLEDVLMLYARQNGRCAVTGMTLILEKALHPESMALAKKNPLEEQGPKNSLLVTLAIKPFIDKWGIQYLRKVSKKIVKHRKEKV